MKKINFWLVFGILTTVLCFSTCRNSIMETWWDSEAPVPSALFYTVSFQANGGEPAPEPQRIAHNGRIAKVMPMSRGEYAFGGWYTDSNFTNEWNFAADVVESDLVLYAKWAAASNIVITFNANGGYPAPVQQRLINGAKVVEPLPMRRASDGAVYGFGGWFSDTDFNYRWDFANYTVNNSYTLYAKWDTPAHCRITFVAGGGEPPPFSQDLLEGARIVEPLAMNREGYGFGGWYTDPNFIEGSEWDFNTPVGRSSITLFARWVTNYFIVIFDARGGSPSPVSQRVARGALLSNPSLPRKSGESFMGWYKDEYGADGGEWNFALDRVDREGIVLYAKWGEPHYVVRFNLKLPPDVLSGLDRPPLAPEDQELTSGRKIFEPPAGAVSGWSFYGWSYSDNPDFNPENQEHRDALIDWDFDWVINLEADDSLTYTNNQGSKRTLNTIHDAGIGDIFTLYARWVPVVQDMVWVRKGSFMMGAGTSSLPLHNVRFSTGFYMAKYQLTQEEYSEKEPSHANHFSAPRRPVDKASWYDAAAYCNWRSMQDALLTPVYSLNGDADPANWGPRPWDNIEMNMSANGYRLPTEAEWEYAARGGDGSPGNFLYAGANNAEDVAWFNENSGFSTHLVGTKLPNGLGVYDMSGNLFEWCWDWYSPTAYLGRQNAIDPIGPDSGTQRVRRGGCWSNAVANVRSTARASFVPSNDTYVMGFRVVRGPVTIY